MLAILWNDLACYLQDRPALFWTFLGPIVCMTLFGYLTQPPPAHPALIVLINHASADSAARLSQILQNDGYQTKESAQIIDNQWNVELSPPDPDATNAPPVRLLLHGGEAEFEEERLVHFELQKALTEMTATAAPPHPIQVTTLQTGFTPHTITRGFQRTVPGYLLMFLTLNLLVAGANLAEDRASGRLRRMTIAPVRKGSIVAGKLLARLCIAWTQIIVLFALGYFVFRINLGEHPFLLLAFLSLYALAMGGLGILLGVLIRDPDQAQTIAIWTAILLAPLGGLWWPIELMGPPFRALSMFLPPGWAMQAVNSLIAFGGGFSAIAWPALGLATLALVSSMLASSRLRA
jgi:ABC-type Na+ efflux pump permease subunit